MPQSLERRYRLCPQLRVYDRLEPVLTPYVTFSSPANFRSPVVNTDRHGFRVSHAGQVRVDTESWWQANRRGLVLGGSFVFGFGSTEDRQTMVSQLGRRTGVAFLNLGIRAGNSLQELIAALPFLSAADTVVVCSGINTLVTHLQSSGGHDLYGPLFGEEWWSALSMRPVREVAQLAARGRLSGWLGPTRNGHRASAPARRAQGDLDAAMARAERQQERDLRLLARALPERIRPVFAVQPFAESLSKAFAEEELALFQLNDTIGEERRDHWHALKSQLRSAWSAYAGRLRQVCQRLGIPCVDLNRVAFEGWCFVDRIHMTDHGQAQVASHLAQVVGSCAA